jgi:hypothetical protein
VLVALLIRGEGGQEHLTENGRGATNSWQAIAFDRGAYYSVSTPDAAAVERAALFFGPPTNGWARVLLPNYHRFLTAIHEPSLFAGHTNGTAHEYRLLFLPARSHPQVVRLYVTRGKQVLRVYFWAQPDTPTAPDELYVTETACAPGQWTDFTNEVRACGFWELPSHRDEPEGMHGYRLVLEALEGGKYHMVDRWCNDDPPFEKLCLGLRGMVSRLELERSLQFYRTQERLRASQQADN